MLRSIHLIPQADFPGYIQSEVADAVACFASPGPVVGGANRALVEHRTGPAGIAVEYGMEGTPNGVVSAQHAVVYRSMAHGTTDHPTLVIKDKEIPADDIVAESAAIDGSHELCAPVDDLRCRRHGRISSVGKKCVRFETGGIVQ